LRSIGERPDHSRACTLSARAAISDGREGDRAGDIPGSVGPWRSFFSDTSDWSLLALGRRF
jgi:hypothetical protein